jgi:hypothetical protein
LLHAGQERIAILNRRATSLVLPALLAISIVHPAEAAEGRKARTAPGRAAAGAATTMGPALFPGTAWGAAWTAELDAISALLSRGLPGEALALSRDLETRIDVSLRSGTPPEQVSLAALRIEVERLGDIAEAATRGLGVAASARPTDIAGGARPAARSIPDLLEGFTLKGVIARYVDYYSGPGRKGFEATRARRADSWKWMEEILEEEGLPTSLACVSLVESGINPEAVSPHRAVGQWQFLAGTARRFGLTVNRWLDERKDPELSTRAAARYLSYLYGMFRSWPLALAAYNAGEGTIQRAIRNQGTDDFFQLRLPQQTQEFVGRCLASMWLDQNADRFGISPRGGSRPNFSHMVVASSTPLRSVARFHGTTPEVLRSLNPALFRGATPPGAESYAVRVPAGAHDPEAREPDARADEIAAGGAEADAPGAAAAPDAPASPASGIQRIQRVRKGDTLYSISRKYGATLAEIRALNPGTSGNRILVGQRLVIPASPQAAAQD